jgi:hypothetical protein
MGICPWGWVVKATADALHPWDSKLFHGCIFFIPMAREAPGPAVCRPAENFSRCSMANCIGGFFMPENETFLGLTDDEVRARRAKYGKNTLGPG